MYKLGEITIDETKDYVGYINYTLMLYIVGKYKKYLDIDEYHKFYKNKVSDLEGFGTYTKEDAIFYDELDSDGNVDGEKSLRRIEAYLNSDLFDWIICIEKGKISFDVCCRENDWSKASEKFAKWTCDSSFNPIEIDEEKLLDLLE